MRVGRGKDECVVLATSAATHHARHFFPTNRVHKYIYVCTAHQILVARTLLLVRRHREEQLLGAAIVPVAGSFLSSSAAVACWVTNGKLTLRFGMNFSNQGDLLGTLRRVRAAGHVQEAWWAALKCRMLTELSASLQAKLLKHQKRKRLVLIHSKLSLYFYMPTEWRYSIFVLFSHTLRSDNGFSQ